MIWFADGRETLERTMAACRLLAVLLVSERSEPLALVQADPAVPLTNRPGRAPVASPCR
jgi:hypothetical protein